MLKFIIKKVYGRYLFYPVNAQAKAICTIAGQKTLTTKDVQLLDKSFDVESLPDMPVNIN